MGNSCFLKPGPGLDPRSVRNGCQLPVTHNRAPRMPLAQAHLRPWKDAGLGRGRWLAIPSLKKGLAAGRMEAPCGRDNKKEGNPATNAGSGAPLQSSQSTGQASRGVQSVGAMGAS